MARERDWMTCHQSKCSTNAEEAVAAPDAGLDNEQPMLMPNVNSSIAL